MPLLDNLAHLPLDRPDERLEQAKRALGGLPSGVTHFLIHPSKDTPELRAITPDWPSRVADYETFRRDDLLAFLRQEGIQVIGYRALRDLLRKP
jgi:hypothetical protein